MEGARAGYGKESYVKASSGNCTRRGDEPRDRDG